MTKQEQSIRNRYIIYDLGSDKEIARLQLRVLGEIAAQLCRANDIKEKGNEVKNED